MKQGKKWKLEEGMKEVKNEVKKDIDGKEEKKKWMKWWKERNEKDKSEMIEKFEQLSSSDFGSWILNHSKWKNHLNNENIPAIYAAIQTYIDYHFTDDVLFFFFLFKLQKSIDNLCHFIK
ncbi:hypothetical protein RFI_37224 [Reticulomyxa filosa]|uniref:Uncharacterized protein n=1 Tax=Reticulomyxa filosa TaxID=46433 RepID=X6LDY9_RETFI|nr:hypothetical protein RFI_37224 [Reticulomyxa filosa]|eukprot:ETO00223.1 hypothetical protein RFI_37224 [Reticulomyxa filosa]